jgi:hypothetical protein
VRAEVRTLTQLQLGVPGSPLPGHLRKIEAEFGDERKISVTDH